MAKRKQASTTRARVASQLRARPVVIDAHTHVGSSPAAWLSDETPYALSAESLVVRMEADRIGAAVCFPFAYSEYFDAAAYAAGRLRRSARARGSVPFEFENRRLMREVYETRLDAPPTLLPFAFFDPGREQGGQARLIRALARRYPLYGLKTATSYLRSHVTRLRGAGACLLDLAAELDVPVTIHSAVHPHDPWADVSKILDVVRARADVRFVVAHTCRFDRRALETAAELDNCFVDFSAFHIHCELALVDGDAVAPKKRRFPAKYRDHTAAMARIAEAFPATMVWGSDVPYHRWHARFVDDRGRTTISDLACGPHVEAKHLYELDARTRRRIAYTNTMRMLFGPAASGKKA